MTLEQQISRIRELISQRDVIDNEIADMLAGTRPVSRESVRAKKAGLLKAIDEHIEKSETKPRKKWTRRKMDDGKITPNARTKHYRCQDCDAKFYSTLHLADASCPECNSINILKM